jgi:hypothetical protein
MKRGTIAVRGVGCVSFLLSNPSERSESYSNGMSVPLWGSVGSSESAVDFCKLEVVAMGLNVALSLISRDVILG